MISLHWMMIQHHRTGIDHLYFIYIRHTFKIIRKAQTEKTINGNTKPSKKNGKSAKKVNLIRLVRDLYSIYDS